MAPVEGAGPGQRTADALASNARASALMHDGFDWLRRARGPDPARALACFDAARAIRCTLPLDRCPVFRYDLAACWLNRAEALACMGPEATASALGAVDEALALLRTLPLREDSRYPDRLAVACHHRARLQLHLGDGRGALDACAEALAALDRCGSGRPSRRTFLRAVCRLEQARAWLSLSTSSAIAEADAAARAALALASAAERDDLDAAEVGLQSRHFICRLFARLADEVAPGARPGWLDEATDLTDEGLAVARAWEARGTSRLRTLAVDLFRFGARLYARWQPRFLREFIDEQLDSRLSSPAFVRCPALLEAVHEAEALRVTPAITIPRIPA
jgi:hypothetical protein